MNKNESSFSYTYFANQQAEVENIRKKISAPGGKQL